MRNHQSLKRLRVTFEITAEEAAPIDMLGEAVAALLRDSGLSGRAAASVRVVDLDAHAAVAGN
jgi:hypothetical protein